MAASRRAGWGGACQVERAAPPVNARAARGRAPPAAADKCPGSAVVPAWCPPLVTTLSRPARPMTAPPPGTPRRRWVWPGRAHRKPGGHLGGRGDERHRVVPDPDGASLPGMPETGPWEGDNPTGLQPKTQRIREGIPAKHPVSRVFLRSRARVEQLARSLVWEPSVFSAGRNGPCTPAPSHVPSKSSLFVPRGARPRVRLHQPAGG